MYQGIHEDDILLEKTVSTWLENLITTTLLESDLPLEAPVVSTESESYEHQLARNAKSTVQLLSQWMVDQGLGHGQGMRLVQRLSQVR
jgi:hypothetical protein